MEQVGEGAACGATCRPCRGTSTDSGEIKILAYLARRIGDAILVGKGGHFILVRLKKNI